MTKMEMRSFMVQECRIYLPKPVSTTIYFMKSILTAKKEVSADINHFDPGRLYRAVNWLLGSSLFIPFTTCSSTYAGRRSRRPKFQ